MFEVGGVLVNIYCRVEQAVGYHIRRGVCEHTVHARYTEIRGIH